MIRCRFLRFYLFIMKKLIVLFSLIALTACSSQDKSYYLGHPEAMQKALNECPAKSPGKISCSELKEVAVKFNQMANELRLNPQAFGKKILSLQEQLANAKLKGNEKTSIQKLDNEITERLIMVKLFESPEG